MEPTFELGLQFGKERVNLAQRMKEYENQSKELDKKFLIIRCDMKNGTSYTKKFKKPFDDIFTDSMIETTGAVHNQYKPILSYTQSDEISFLFHNFDLFNLRRDKIVSILASTVTANFNKFISRKNPNLSVAIFDCRAFNLPDRETCLDYFQWRNRYDCQNNSLGLIASKHAKNEQLHEKNAYRRLNYISEELMQNYRKENIYGTFFKNSSIEKEGYNPITKETVLVHRKVAKSESFLMNEDKSNSFFHDLLINL